MAWVQPINIMTLEELNTAECQICFNPLYVVSAEIPNPNPSEITTCHHRFHRNCLRDTWCNNNAGNTLDACRCPTCNQVFNCNTQLEDLSGQVAERMRILQEPPVVPVEVPMGRAVLPVARGQQIDNLHNYTLTNYRIDQIKKRFIDCITEILNDAWGLVEFYPEREGGLIRRSHYYRDIAGYLLPYGKDENTRELAKSAYISGQIIYINEFVDNVKNNTPFLTDLRNVLETLTVINGRLQDVEFTETLNDPRQGPYLSTYRRGTYYISYTGKVDYLLNFLGECYAGRIIPPRAAPPNQTFENPFPNNVKDLILTNMVNEFLRFKKNYYTLDRNTHNHREEPYYVNALLPLDTDEEAPYAHLDLQFFRRYFQCFVEFITELLDVNYDTVFQMGGKKRRTKRRKTNKRQKTRNKKY